jgi:ankyrin repeat protein
MKLSKTIVVGFAATMWLGTAWVSARQDEADQLQALFHYPQVVALARAATSGDIAAIDRLLEQNVDINARGYRGITVLLATLEAENKEGFQALLQHGADPNLLTDHGASAVHLSANHADPWWLETTLRHGGNPNLVNTGNPYFPNQTPLFYAISRSFDPANTDAARTAKVKLLIAAGANVNHRDDKDIDPLREAVQAQWNSFEIVWLLLDAGADFRVRDKHGRNLIDYISSCNNAETESELTAEQAYWLRKVVRFLIDHGVDLEDRGESPMPQSASGDQATTPKIVRERRSPPDAMPASPTRSDDIPSFPPNVIEIKPQGEFAEIDTEKQIAAMKALGNGDADMIKAVIESPQSYSPPVLCQLAFTLFAQGDKDEAVFWFYAGVLRARSDAQKSNDISARQGVGVLNMYGQHIHEYAFSDREKLLETIRRVVEWDKATPRDYDPRWIALHGMGAFLDSEVAFEPPSEWDRINTETREAYWRQFEEILNWPPKDGSDKGGNVKPDR